MSDESEDPAVTADAVREAVRRALDAVDAVPVVLAVSGGRDSMALLDAAAALRGDRLVVATFDHGTGAHATAAVALVAREGAARGLRVETGRAAEVATTEAAWRVARWRFLRAVARSLGDGAVIATAHTRDDQVETVLMRALREAGARGLAALHAPGVEGEPPIVRPLLGVGRAAVAAYARARGVRWLEDPTNRSRAHLRNRVRLDLLPALRRASPGIEAELLDLSARAAAWRLALARVVDAGVPQRRMAREALDVAVPALDGYSPEALAVVWGELAGRVGLALDRRGTRRLVEFTIRGRVGARIQLSGGWEAFRTREWFELRRGVAAVPPTALADAVRWGRWRFERVTQALPDDPWSATLPDGPLIVRRWQAGDVMAVAGEGAPRKVKRLLAAARVVGHKRLHWPVVLAGDSIVWIPGVRRSDAATVRSGRPALSFRCELHDR